MPDGIFVTGPTGSGKSTTLYSPDAINKPDRKIITIEDRLSEILGSIRFSQSGCRNDFFGGIASYVETANIVMVGETRDLETAEIAINAS